ncbi:MAG: hypothetical protein KC910_28630, partial [Candidatus Eremiobacteraeota bacterium]|nr:hypothetical protein [Candidatus Eremiobacteraeota bacterium]
VGEFRKVLDCPEFALFFIGNHRSMIAISLFVRQRFDAAQRLISQAIAHFLSDDYSSFSRLK